MSSAFFEEKKDHLVKYWEN